MPNVRLRTIINQDNSTTFQVQFHEGGEWEDLTWDMISDKPFETLDDTVFIVDENGVLTITDVPTVCSWGDVSDKPFIFLDPDDFSVSASGVLSYTGSLDWSSIVGKPFSTVDNSDFIITGGVLKLRPITVNVGWDDVSSKPFTYLDSSDFEVTSDTLKVKHQTIPDPDWQDVLNKPFSSLDSDDFSVDADGEVSVNFPTPTPDDWDDVTNKPFETLNGTDFSVDADGEVSVNFPTPTPDDWDDITNKPFESLNGTDFSVDADGEVSVNFPTPTPDDWDDVTGKPFESIGSGLSVDQDGVLSATGGGGGNPSWNDVTSKPFSTLGEDLYEYNGVLNSKKFMYMSTAMSNSHKITSLNDMRTFLKTYCENSVNYLMGLIAQPNDGYWGNIFAANDYKRSKMLFHHITMKVDNTGDLSQYGDTYDIVLQVSAYSLSGGSIYCFINAYGLPDFDNPNHLININGYVYVMYYGPNYQAVSSNLFKSECEDYFFS